MYREHLMFCLMVDWTVLSTLGNAIPKTVSYLYHWQLL